MQHHEVLYEITTFGEKKGKKNPMKERSSLYGRLDVMDF